MTKGPKENPAPSCNGKIIVGADPVHYSVGAVLITPDNKFLVQLRDDREDLIMRAHLGLFGGTVDDGETPREAIVRELYEELEYRPTEVNWFTELIFNPPESNFFVCHKTYFHVPVTEDEISKMVLHEGEAIVFIEPSEIGQRPIVPWDAWGVTFYAMRRLWITEHRRVLNAGRKSPFGSWID